MSLTETSSAASSPGNSLEGYRKFFPHPNQITISVGEGENRRLESIPIVHQPLTPVQYQDVGDNKYLQSEVTSFFHEKVLKWIKENPEFSHLKKHYNFLKGPSGKEYIYNMLRLFVKKSAANWFDLRDANNYIIVKDYLRYKIGNI
jgi:hypothetical protein